jgi:biopolymer transport protein ExbD
MLSRRKDLGGGFGVDLGIIVTPMLDMAFQLLAFFIMTYHPPAREAVVDGTLLPPPVIRGADKTKDPKKVSPSESVIKTKLRILVKAVPAQKGADETLERGQPKEIILERPRLHSGMFATLKQPGAKPGDAPADLGAALKALAKELAKSLDNPEEKNLELTIDADRGLRYGYFMAVREVAEASGFKKISFNAPR